MKSVVLGFGLLIFALLVLFQLARFSRFQASFDYEWWIVIFSVAFFVIGIGLNRYFRAGKSVTNNQTTPLEPVSPEILQKHGISQREFEVLILINEGFSNQQIAKKLFLSENTIKKHVSNLFFKLDASRRTEAIRRAKELRLLN